MVAGYRLFENDDILTGPQVDDFLAKQAVMKFADAAARDSALGTATGGANALREGMLTYNDDAGKLEVYNGTSWAGVSAVKKIAAFTASGTWTVPAGVTYAIAHMLGGGGGAGGSSVAGTNGAASSVAFVAGTVTSPGGAGGQPAAAASLKQNEAANGGRGGRGQNPQSSGGDGTWLVAAAAVTAAADITVTVGAGGNGGTTGLGDGGSGYVYIEYYE